MRSVTLGLCEARDVTRARRVGLEIYAPPVRRTSLKIPVDGLPIGDPKLRRAVLVVPVRSSIKPRGLPILPTSSEVGSIALTLKVVGGLLRQQVDGEVRIVSLLIGDVGVVIRVDLRDAPIHTEAARFRVVVSRDRIEARLLIKDRSQNVRRHSVFCGSGVDDRHDIRRDCERPEASAALIARTHRRRKLRSTTHALRALLPFGEANAAALLRTS